MKNFATNLLSFYDKHKRDLPWRHNTTPYRVWLSEIMLQQTTVVTVIPYFNTFVEKFPTVTHLAEADLDDVLSLWQGLGYYSRARNLHKCAQTVVNDFNGAFPNTEKELLNLPGIGPYTAAAIASMAFNQKATVLDGNVERVMARLHRISNPLPKSKPELKELAIKATPNTRNSCYSNAIMELGATVCTPKNPKCDICPASTSCKAFKKGDMLNFPKKEPKKKRPTKTGSAYCIFDVSGKLFLQQRPETGLLAKLWEVPNKDWDKQDNISQTSQTTIDTDELIHCGGIKHVFTHFTLELDVYRVDLKETINETQWFSEGNYPALPTLMQKVIQKSKENS